MSEVAERSARAISSFWVWLVAIAVTALALRLGHRVGILLSPVGDTLVGDARYYHEEAARILGALPAQQGPTFMNVGYPYFLAAIYAVAGWKAGVVLWLQALLGGCAAVGVALAARALLGARAGVLAGLLYAGYSGAVLYDGLLLTPSATNLFVVAAAWAGAEHLRRASVLSAAAAGAALGFAALLRSNLLLLVPLFALVALLADGARHVRRTAALALLGAAAVLPLTVVLFNGAVHGEWLPVSANGGMGFWVGNNRAAEGVYSIAPFVGSQNPGDEEVAFLEEARRRSGDPQLSLGGSSGFWLREGLREIRAAPGRWLRLELRKLALFWNRYETRTNVGLAFYRELSPVLALAPVGYGLLVVLGLGGLAQLCVERRRRAAALVAALLGVPLATCLLFFVSGEYRHPASIALCIAAAALLDAVWRLARERPRALAPAAAVLLLALPLTLWRHPLVEASGDTTMDYWNHAAALSFPRPDGTPPSRADFARAIELLERAPTAEGGAGRGGHDLILLDARLWVRYRAAVELDDPAEATRALELAERIAAALAEPSAPSGPFVTQLRRSLPDRIDDLARRPVVRDDPARAARAARLLHDPDSG